MQLNKTTTFSVHFTPTLKVAYLIKLSSRKTINLRIGGEKDVELWLGYFNCFSGLEDCCAPVMEFISTKGILHTTDLTNRGASTDLCLNQWAWYQTDKNSRVLSQTGRRAKRTEKSQTVTVVSLFYRPDLKLFRILTTATQNIVLWLVHYFFYFSPSLNVLLSWSMIIPYVFFL